MTKKSRKVDSVYKVVEVFVPSVVNLVLVEEFTERKVNADT